MNQNHLNAFEQGWESADDNANPYYPSSENFDAYRLAFFLRAIGHGYPTKTIRKSRGYTWRIDGEVWRSESGLPIQQVPA